MNYTLRAAKENELDAINRVVSAAVMTWDLPERVKRLSLPSYHYDALDYKHLQIWIALSESSEIIAVAACEEAEPQDCPEGTSGILLHGLYVDPRHQGHGIGKALLKHAALYAQKTGASGLLVKAQADAEGFFTAQGLTLLEVEDSQRHYAHRFWLTLD